MKTQLQNILLGLALTASASGQTYYGVIDGSNSNEALGRVERMGDVDGDGVADLLVVAVGDSPPQLGSLGSIRIHSGRDLSILVGPILGPQVPGNHSVGPAYWVEAAGDFNGDGIPDFMRGFPSGLFPPFVLVYSGVDGSVLHNFPDPGVNDWGASLAPLGDVDGDGFDDVILGEEFGDEYFVYGGPDGHLIRTHPSRGGLFTSACAIGNLDGDGVPDYALGYPGIGVYLHSGATGALIDQIHESWPGFGQDVCSLSDFDGDGIDDLAVGAVFRNGLPQFGRVFVYSGATRQLVYELAEDSLGAAGGRGFGSWVAGGDDLNGDGTPDLVVAIPGDYAGFDRRGIEVFSLRTGVRLWAQGHPRGPERRFEHPAILGDLDGDGLAEWAWADWPAPYGGGYGAGRIWIARGTPADADRFCAPPSGGTGAGNLRLDWSGPLNLGHAEQRFTLENGPPGALALILYGSPGPPQPLGNGQLCLAAPLQRLASPLILDAAGSAAMPLDWTGGPQRIGPYPWLVGSTWAVQAVYRSAANLDTTGAWRITWTP